MTVTELIVRLNQAPPNAKVIVRGYENGYNDVLELRSLSVKQNPEANWYDGEYEKSEATDGIEAIEIYGENKISE
ncbi:MAG: hypothetical protein Q7J86_02175 [Bacteroidota bacterium]|nr:hypothetical protein [Bacteroidota bacterium]MDO9613314.1 hypothetical protein [Bacteroidota bacterium]